MSAPDSDFFERHLATVRMMAILRGYGPERTLELCSRAWDVGAQLVEIPVQSSDDLQALLVAVAEGRARDRAVGAGTVTSVRLVEQVADAGAAFTVAPGLDEEVLAASRAAGLPHLPGVATATEIHRACQLGATWLKAFPAVALGANWFTAMRGPFPQVRLVATGGVDADNAEDFLAGGAAAVSLGSAFADADLDGLRRIAAPSAATS